MRPPDAVDGWDDELNAELYGRFTRDYPFYADTSRDLASRADLGNSQVVVDLCGGTGVTASILLESMPPQGRVISVDNATAMQVVGRRTYTDPRITWVAARAEDVAEHVPAADAVVCNSAIWKTDVPAVFAAVKRLLRPGGRFVFNIGGGFAGLNSGGTRATPSLTDLITTIAVRDYGYQPPRDADPGPALTALAVQALLANAGFSVLAADVVTYHGTVEEKRAWLSIPLFARPPGQFTHQQRMDILSEAYNEVDKTRGATTRWLVVVAQA